MMSGEHLAWLALVAMGGAIPLLLWSWLKKKDTLLRNALIIGGLAGGLDIIVESIGTFNKLWTYEKSAYFLFGHVPIELPLMFFGAGVLFAGVHAMLAHSPWSPSLRLAQGAVLVLGVAVYAWWIGSGDDITMLVVTVPLGFWGYEQLPSQRIRSLSLLLAAAIGLLDYFLEAWIVGVGNYGYTSGFTPETPLTYAMLILMLLGILERLRPQNESGSPEFRDAPDH